MSVVERFGRRGAATAAEPERQEPALEATSFLVHKNESMPLDTVDARLRDLRDLRENLVIPAATAEPAPDPLHPAVAELMNKQEIAAAEKLRDEANAQAQIMLVQARETAAKEVADAEQFVKTVAEWGARLVDDTQRLAAVTATRLLKQRNARAAFAAAQAAYDAPDLPATTLPAEPVEQPDAPSA